VNGVVGNFVFVAGELVPASDVYIEMFVEDTLTVSRDLSSIYKYRSSIVMCAK
jgi:hypothetical protein